MCACFFCVGGGVTMSSTGVTCKVVEPGSDLGLAAKPDIHVLFVSFALQVFLFGHFGHRLIN